MEEVFYSRLRLLVSLFQAVRANGRLTIILLALLIWPAAGQQLSQTRQLHVRVRDARGAPIVARIPVNLRGRVGNIHYTAYTEEDGSLTFRGLVADDYTVEVTVSGYLPAVETITLPLGFPNVHPQLHIYLRKESDVESDAPAFKPLESDSKAYGEIKKAREKLQKNDLKAAEKHLQRALKAEPAHPEAYYLLGMLCLRREMSNVAQEHFEKALELYPQHVPALRALSRILYQNGDVAGATQRLEQVLTVTNRFADDHMLLAEALFQQDQPEKAAFHARQAAELDEEKQTQMRLLLCRILLVQRKYAEAEDSLDAFLKDFPDHPDAGTARDVLQQIRQTRAASGDAPGGATAGGDSAAGLGATLSTAKPASPEAPIALDSLETTKVETNWAPPDVDANPPVVFHDVPCNTTELLTRVSERVQDMAGNLGDVDAEETVSHFEIDRHGQPKEGETRRFAYALSVQAARDGTLIFRETRDGTFGVEALGGFAANAIAAMALVFHPYYAGDFEMRCEGQGLWHGQPVWYVHFRQRPDKPARIHRLRSRYGTSYRIPLKGRAWVKANSDEIVRMEVGLVEPLREARLEREQMVIEYGPVRFEERKRTFWLPTSADIYMTYRGQSWHRQHVLRNYVHFAVDTKQKIASPNPPGDPPP